MSVDQGTEDITTGTTVTPIEHAAIKRPLSRADIMQRAKTKRERVPIKALGGDIFVQSISAVQKEAMEREAIVIDPTAEGGQRVDITRYKLSAVMCGWVDETGDRMFVGDNARAEVGALDSGIIDAVFDAVQKISGAKTATGESAAKNS